jgi:hypothetical protein
VATTESNRFPTDACTDKQRIKNIQISPFAAPKCCTHQPAHLLLLLPFFATAAAVARLIDLDASIDLAVDALNRP